MHRPRMRRAAAAAMIAAAMTAGTAAPSILGLWLYAAPAHPTHISAQPSGVPDQLWGDTSTTGTTIQPATAGTMYHRAAPQAVDGGDAAPQAVDFDTFWD